MYEFDLFENAPTHQTINSFCGQTKQCRCSTHRQPIVSRMQVVIRVIVGATNLFFLILFFSNRFNSLFQSLPYKFVPHLQNGHSMQAYFYRDFRIGKA